MYLTLLNYRSKWKTTESKIGINELVLVKEDNVKRGQWPLVRYVVTHPWQEGTVRVITVITLTASNQNLLIRKWCNRGFGRWGECWVKLVKFITKMESSLI